MTLYTISNNIDMDSIQGMDNATAVTAMQICNVVFDADAWTIATMSVKYVGVGIRLASDVALPAYLASTATSKYIVDLILSTNSSLHMDATRA